MSTAEETAEGSAAPAEGEGKKKSKLPMILGGVVVLLLVAGAGLYFTGMLDGLLGKKAAPVAAAPPPPKPLVFFDLPDFLVNLNSGNSKKASFLKLSVSLELENQEDTAKLQAVMPRVIDTFQVYLRELRVDDLQGSAGLFRLARRVAGARECGFEASQRARQRRPVQRNAGSVGAIDHGRRRLTMMMTNSWLPNGPRCRKRQQDDSAVRCRYR